MEFKKRLVETEFISKSKCLVLREFVCKLIDLQSFTFISTLLILSNTVTLAMDRYPISRAEQNALEQANLVFTITFAVEMVLKLIGYGLKKYVSDSLNIFDAVIVIISLTESILDSVSINLSSGR